MDKTIGNNRKELNKGLAKNSKEGSILRIAYIVICSVFSGFMMFYYLLGRVGTLEIRGIFVTVILTLCFFPKVADRSLTKILDLILMALSIIVGVYFLKNNYAMKLSFFSLDTVSIIMGCLMAVLILEATRRKLGIVMPIIALLFLLYALFGFIIPGKYHISGYSFSRIVNIAYTGTEGIFGSPTGVMVSTVFLFVLFGALLQLSGAGIFFINLSKAAFGKVVGGPAKMAVVSSALFGSINGSAVANTVATGSFTIPIMKEAGYDSDFAGAVEAAASTGGQLMPPIMGAGAFLMAELTGTPYSTIALVSIIPAILFYMAIFFSIHLEAKKKNLGSIAETEIPSVKEVLRRDGFCAIPLVVLLVLILVMRYSVQYSAIIAIIFILMIGVMKNKGKDRISFIIAGINDAVTSILSIAVSCACAGIIIAMVTLTGLGYKFSSSLLNLSDGNLFLALVLLFLIGLVLGMGLPTVAAFILMVSIAGSGLTKLGLPILTAYMISFWFSQTSAITPPVCLAAYAAAGIAKAKPLKVGINAIKIGFPLLIIPFLMAYRSLLFTGSVSDTVFTVVSGTIGILAFCIFFVGYYKEKLKWYQYVIVLFSGVACFWPNPYADLVGIILFVVLIFSPNFKKRVHIK